MGKKTNSRLAVGVGLLILASTACAAGGKMDVKELLAKVRKAQMPSENMRIEWIQERAKLSGVRRGRGPSSKVLPELSRKWSAVICGIRSRIERREEYFDKPELKEANRVKDVAQVFDGTKQLQLDSRTKGYKRPRKNGHIRLTEINYYLLRRELFNAHRLPIYDQKRLKDYKLTLAESNTPGVYILDVSKNGGLHRLTIDGNQGYNVVRIERFRADGSTDYEDNFKVKLHPGGTWFISERERIRHGRKANPRPRVEMNIKITRVQFDIPVPDDKTFKLSFPEGATLMDWRGQQPFEVGCLKLASHTKEKAAVTAILAGAGEEVKTSGRKEAFGPVSEQKILSIEQRKECFIDFESGRVLSIPTDFHLQKKEGQKQWFEANGIDGRVETDKNLCGLWACNTVVIPISNKRWDTITAEACHKVFGEAKGIYPPVMSAEGKLPATFLFQTWDSRGILQVLEARRDGKSRYIKVRYKMIEESLKSLETDRKG